MTYFSEHSVSDYIASTSHQEMVDHLNTIFADGLTMTAP